MSEHTHVINGRSCLVGANEPRTRLPVLCVTCLPADPLTWMAIYLTYVLCGRRFVSLPDYVSYSSFLLFTYLHFFSYSLSFIHSFVHLLFLLTHFTFFSPIRLSSYSVTQSFHSLASIQSFNQSITHSPIDMFPNVLDITFNYSSVIHSLKFTRSARQYSSQSRTDSIIYGATCEGETGKSARCFSQPVSRPDSRSQTLG